MDLTGGVCPIQTSNLLKRNKECLAVFIKGTYYYITLCISYGKKTGQTFFISICKGIIHYLIIPLTVTVYKYPSYQRDNVDVHVS